MTVKCILEIDSRGLSSSKLYKKLGFKLKKGDLIRAHIKGKNKLLLEKVKVISDKT